MPQFSSDVNLTGMTVILSRGEFWCLSPTRFEGIDNNASTNEQTQTEFVIS